VLSQKNGQFGNIKWIFLNIKWPKMARMDQEQLLEIFNALRKEMAPYEKGHIKARMDIAGKYDLWTEKPGMMAAGRHRSELSFVTIIIQSSYVGFYYMPVYTNCQAVTQQLSPRLMGMLKGKACFHIKAADNELMKDIRAAMKAGYEMYKKNGWV
jgi:hypothetical protein